MGRKYDWIKLEKEFMKGDYKTVAEFIEDKGLPKRSSNSYIAVKTTGWADKKRERRRKALEKATERSIQEEFSDIEERRARQARIARWMQVKGVEDLKGQESRSVDEARKLIATGLKEERAILGMESSRGGGPKVATQVNINLPKTRFDERLEEADYDELVEFIAEIKRAKQGRTEQPVREGVSVGSEEATE